MSWAQFRVMLAVFAALLAGVCVANFALIDHGTIRALSAGLVVFWLGWAVYALVWARNQSGAHRPNPPR